MTATERCIQSSEKRETETLRECCLGAVDCINGTQDTPGSELVTQYEYRSVLINRYAERFCLIEFLSWRIAQLQAYRGLVRHQ